MQVCGSLNLCLDAYIKNTWDLYFRTLKKTAIFLKYTSASNILSVNILLSAEYVRSEKDT